MNICLTDYPHALDCFSKAIELDNSNHSAFLGKAFVYYHQEDYLTEALYDNGFKIINLQRKDYPESKDESRDLIIIAQKSF